MKDNNKSQESKLQESKQNQQKQQKLLKPFKNLTLFQQLKNYYYNIVYQSSTLPFKMIHDRYYNKHKYNQIISLMKSNTTSQQQTNHQKLLKVNRQKIRSQCQMSIDHDSMYSAIPPLQQTDPNHQQDQHRLIFEKYIRDYERVALRSSIARVDALSLCFALLGSYIYKFKAKFLLVSLWIPGFFCLAKNLQSLYRDISPAQKKISELLKDQFEAYSLFYQVGQQVQQGEEEKK